MSVPRFPTKAEVSDALEELAEQRDFYEAVSGTEIPKSLKEALDGGWELIAKGVVIEWLLAYKPRQRALDRQRVIPLETALSIIAQWEEKLIVDHVLQRKEVAWKVLGIIPLVVEEIWSNGRRIWEALKTVFNLLLFPSAESLRKAVLIVWSGFGAFLTAICIALRPGPFQVVILSVLKDRDRVEKLLRARALPQGKGRIRRRKVTRV